MVGVLLLTSQMLQFIASFADFSPKSLPDDYVFHPINQLEPVAMMVGNAVPPKLASFFANYLVNSATTRIASS